MTIQLSSSIPDPVPNGSSTTVILPNPIFSDSRALDVEVQYYQTINGTRYTYIRQNDGIKLVYTWEVLGRGKLLELEEFLQIYAGEIIQIIDHNSLIWDARLIPGSFSFTTSSLSKNAGGSRTESGDVTLEFIGCLKV